MVDDEMVDDLADIDSVDLVVGSVGEETESKQCTPHK